MGEVSQSSLEMVMLRAMSMLLTIAGRSLPLLDWLAVPSLMELRSPSLRNQPVPNRNISS